MSLVLLVLGEREAIIASDGAAKCVYADGRTVSRYRTDYQKFKIFGDEFLIAVTGSEWLAEERIYPCVGHFLSDTVRSFDETKAFLDELLPQWARECAAYVRALGFDLDSVRDCGVGASVILVGRGPSGSVKGATWESVSVNSGPGTVISGHLVSRVMGEPGGAVAASELIRATLSAKASLPEEAALRGIIEAVSRIRPDVGGTIYTHRIGELIPQRLLYATGQLLIDPITAKTTSAFTVLGDSIEAGGVGPVQSQSRFRCSLIEGAADWTIPNNALTALTWDSELFDVGGLHSTGTNPSRITVPTGGDTGLWLLTGVVQWDGNTTGQRQIQIRKGGAASALTTVSGPDYSFGIIQQVVAVDSDPSVGDYYELLVFQDSGANRTVFRGPAHFTATHLW